MWVRVEGSLERFCFGLRFLRSKVLRTEISSEAGYQRQPGAHHWFGQKLQLFGEAAGVKTVLRIDRPWLKVESTVVE